MFIKGAGPAPLCAGGGLVRGGEGETQVCVCVCVCETQTSGEHSAGGIICVRGDRL